MNWKLLCRSALATTIVAGSCCSPLALRAQEDGANGPPKILVIEREVLKPGKDGAAHEKTEAAFVRALAASKSKTRYFGMTSMSGPSRALFFFGYPSLEAWGATEDANDKDAVLSAALDRANEADGDLLSEFAETAWSRRDDLSLNTHDLRGARYMEITQFKIRDGHMHEWNELVKLAMQGYKKGVPDASWVMFEQVYGTEGHGFIVLTPLKSLAESDHELTTDKGFAAALGEEGMKNIETLSAACIESQQTNLFHFNPKMSYPPERWIEAEPEFWKPKGAVAANKPAAKTTTVATAAPTH